MVGPGRDRDKMQKMPLDSSPEMAEDPSRLFRTDWGLGSTSPPPACSVLVRDGLFNVDSNVRHGGIKNSTETDTHPRRGMHSLARDRAHGHSRSESTFHVSEASQPRPFDNGENIEISIAFPVTPGMLPLRQRP